MGKLVAVSFESNNVKVVYATTKGKGIKVDNALTLRQEEFDDFLKKENSKEFIVAYDFKDFYQGIISIPPVKSKYIKTLLRAGISKNAPELLDFLFVHTVLGEKIVGNRKIQEVFVFAVRKDEIDVVLNRFTSKDKIVKSIYPNVLSLGSLLQSTEESLLCIVECSSCKNLFLTKNGKIQFIRTAQTAQRGITDSDIQNINMTINYCQQSLRTEISNIMLLGSFTDSHDTTIPILKPTTIFSQPANIQAVKEVFHEYVVPISALLGQEHVSLLPRGYKSSCLIKKALVYSTTILLLLSIVGVGYIGLKLRPVAEVENILAPIEVKVSDIEGTFLLYAQKKQELEKYATLLNFSKSTSSISDIQKLLISLSEINTTNIRINSIIMTVNSNILETEIKGTIIIEGYEGYSNMQTHFQNFIGLIDDIKGLKVKNQNLILNNESFVVELDYPVLEERQR